ncbi:unnamed protein product [Cyprideis torosa]|uniref:Serine/threonine-protein kinase RIO1 n=1 Tax=Cyprideis torosa TaxID=163714 RepID=A0A7R8WI37_9CRUS|nr:unnamed protein product [Cyprideis torosa]CAG0894768.1 unnamed protein product [Cyprideis torosa]
MFRRNRVRDKDQRATVEQVMDPRTRMIVFRLLERGVITSINGCISTGKEANVYHATSSQGDLAVKIYKTSILVFKDRDKYVSGEFRFRHGYCKGNPRKMVRTWAEKEMRNYCRLWATGGSVPCPEPLLLKGHVLLMRFIGQDGWPSPLLKDAVLSEPKARELYLDCLLILRALYWDAKLVHADFSEFNLLYHNGKVVVIDVSQAVEHDHPRALVFLRKDCANINDFFRRKGVSILSLRRLFEFVTDPTIDSENLEECVNRLMESVDEEEDEAEQEKEGLFKEIFIPQRLDQVPHYERDILAQLRISDPSEGGGPSISEKEAVVLEQASCYKKLVGLKEDLTGPRLKPDFLDSKTRREMNPEEESCSEEASENEEDEDGHSKFQDSHRPKDETPEARRERKRLVREEKREKRKEKVPKHIKRRKEKVGRK